MKISNQEIELQINKLIDLLGSRQLSEISKASSYEDIGLKNKIRGFEALFSLSFLLHSLGKVKKLELNNPKIKKIAVKLNHYINGQSKDYSFNYFSREFSSSQEKYRLPDNLDDSSLALQALIINGEEIAQEYFLNIINLETKPGGPYRTWYTPKNLEGWSDVDVFVNCNLLYLCALSGIELPKTEKFVISHLKSNKFSSKYYVTELWGLLYLARFQSIKPNKQINSLIVNKLKFFLKNFHKSNHSEKILVGLIQNYLGEPLNDEQLAGLINSIGDKAISTKNLVIFCYDFTHNSEKTYTTSKTFSDALLLELMCLELVNRGYKAKSKEKSIQAASKIIAIQKELAAGLKASKLTAQLLKLFPPAEHSKSIAYPFFIAYDLSSKLTKNQQNKLNTLAKSMYFGWAGYTLLDDLIDQQKHREVLPLASFCLRTHTALAYDCYQDFPKKINLLEKGWLASETEYFDEIKLRRFKRNEYKKIKKNSYQYIRRRMQAYTELLSGIPLLLSIKNSRKYEKALYRIVENTMVIHQLNDDAHDWYEDLKQGVLTFVTQEILANTEPSAKREELEEIFWIQIMPKIIAECTKLKNQAQKEINTFFPDSNLQQILDKNYAPIIQAQKEITNINTLQDYYSK